jgi:hypothetical protein
MTLPSIDLASFARTLWNVQSFKIDTAKSRTNDTEFGAAVAISDQAAPATIHNASGARRGSVGLTSCDGTEG